MNSLPKSPIPPCLSRGIHVYSLITVVDGLFLSYLLSPHPHLRKFVTLVTSRLSVSFTGSDLLHGLTALFSNSCPYSGQYTAPDGIVCASKAIVCESAVSGLSTACKTLLAGYTL